MQAKPFSYQIFPKLFEIANFQIYLPRENLADEMKASDDEIPGLSLICNFFRMLAVITRLLSRLRVWIQKRRDIEFSVVFGLRL